MSLFLIHSRTDFGYVFIDSDYDRIYLLLLYLLWTVANTILAYLCLVYINF